jgi:hypothetical protein
MIVQIEMKGFYRRIAPHETVDGANQSAPAVGVLSGK